jgi:hypothetical protein
MGFDAVAVAGQDLAAGLGFLKKIRDNSPMSWLSANLVQKNTETPIFTPYLTRELAGGPRVAVIGLTGDHATTPTKRMQQQCCPGRRCSALVGKLALADLLVLSPLPASTSRDHSTVAGIHVIVRPGSAWSISTRRSLPATPFYQTSDRASF